MKPLSDIRFRYLGVLCALAAPLVLASAAGSANDNASERAVCPGAPVEAAAAASARCHAHVVTDERGNPLATSGPTGYGPAQFRTAYGLTSTGSAAQTVAIVDAYDSPTIENDLAVYSQTYGLPACTTASGCFRKLNQAGTAGSYPRKDAGWALEIALDVEVAHAVCPGCRILLVEANTNSYSNLLAAEDTAARAGATVISNSWGSGEFSSETSAAYDGHFNKPGVAITVSSGDGGYGVEYPAASRYVTAVGGTRLTLNIDNTRKSETAWSGAGSGCSAYETKPSWQKDSGCARRTVADVSADADPASGASVYDTTSYYGQTGWFKVGGTSLSAPIIAAVYALAGNTGSLVYGFYPYANSGFLFDVTSGANGSCGGSYLCTAGPGYDGPTGLGTPTGTGGF